jgi:hypothetical protein
VDLQRFELAQDRLNRSLSELADTHERLASEFMRAVSVMELFMTALDASLNEREFADRSAVMLQPA